MKKRILSLSIFAAILLTACQTQSELGSSEPVQTKTIPISESTSTTSTASSTSSTSSSTASSTSSTSSTTASSTSSSSSTSDESSSSTAVEIPINPLCSDPQGYFIPNNPNIIYDANGYYIGNHFIEYSNRIYNNDTIYYNEGVRYYALLTGVDKPTNESSVMWYSPRKTSSKTYDIKKTIAWATENWNRVSDICAPFLTKCFRAGGLAIGSDSSTMICLQLLSSGLGMGEFLPVNSDQTVSLPEYARPGDVVQSFCPYEGLMLHSMLYVGNDENGHMRVICRNPENGGKYAYRIDRQCYDCSHDINEVFFFHFYHDDDDKTKYPDAVQNDENVLVYREKTWKLNERFNRQNAIEYAKNHIEDGVGSYGARNLSNCLIASGISVSYPNNSSLLFQLLTSGLGSAHSAVIDSDRTVSLPSYVKEGDVMFVLCREEGGILGSFVVKGADENGKTVLYTKDLVNDETKAYQVDDECFNCTRTPSEVIFFCFNDGE